MLASFLDCLAFGGASRTTSRLDKALRAGDINTLIDVVVDAPHLVLASVLPNK